MKLSAFVTTFNNARTLSACLESVRWAHEIVVLDSFSTDETCEIANRYGAALFQHKFLGYGPQKQMALEHTSNEWVLLLDADEALSPALQEEIQTLLRSTPTAVGYEIPRREQHYWRMSNAQVRHNHFLRLFRRDAGHISSMAVHAAPKVNGRIEKLKASFYHFGETDIHTKVDKLNHYSTGLVADKVSKGKRVHPIFLVLYPPVVFIRSYLFKRGFLNGWIGFINSVTIAFYWFLKYAKLYEHYQNQKYGRSLMPDGAPPSVAEFTVNETRY